mgnify:CR=1 FL=1
MVNIVMGPEGSGKTKLLIDAISRALKTESGSMVCIEKGHTLRYDVDHRVRLIDASEYSIKSYTLLQGFISGLHAGNFDITHIFADGLYKIAHCKDDSETEAFLNWCNQFSLANNVSFTFTMQGDPETAPGYIAKYL